MKPRLFAIYLLIVLAPLTAVAWMGFVLARNDRAMVRVRFDEMMSGRLQEIAAQVSSLLEQRERDLSALGIRSDMTPQELRALTRTFPLARQSFVLDPQGTLVYPSPVEPLTRDEEDFLARTRTIWERGEIPGPDSESNGPANDSEAKTSGSLSPQIKKPAARPTASSGWHTGFWGRGIQLLYWWRDENGFIVGAELNEVRLVADIIGALPDASSLHDGRIELRDSQDTVVYQWGAYLGDEGQRAPVQRALAAPLGSWHLRYIVPDQVQGRALWFSIASGIAALALACLGLATYFYRENTRALREAQQRVTFVNQVSHELKTPLTNIRMYAEVLEDDLAGADESVRRRLDVIVSESQRLSRMIGNVLTFSRNERQLLKLHQTRGNPGVVLRNLASHFEAPLNDRGIRIELETAACRESLFDHDALEQIAGNLLGNVEKYAVGGDLVRVSCTQTEETFAVEVSDNGPGIPLAHRERIFKPFYRISDRLTDGVAGTGLGLTIARELARLHGGDVTLEPSDRGARFKLTLHAPAPTAEIPS